MKTDELTTKNVIKLLPLKEETKLKVLRMYDYLDKNQQLVIARIAWKTYYYIRQERIDMNMEIEMQEIGNGDTKGADDKSLYEDVVKKTDEELLKSLSESSGAVDLATARQAMHQIVKEMQDAKAAKTAKKGTKVHSKTN